MRRVLKEISAIPGVAGSCIFDKNEGAVCAELNAELPKTLIEQVGIHLVRMVQMGSMNQLQVRSAQFRFDRYSVVGVSLEQGAVLLAVCDAQANCSLVASTAFMLVQEMGCEQGNPQYAWKRKEAEPSIRLSARPAAVGVTEELRSLLKEIEGALASAIGPAAFLVLAEYLNRWREKGSVDRARLPELIGMLVNEIDDKNLVQQFKGQLSHIL